MTALNDTERAAQKWSAAARPDRPAPVRPERAETVPAARTGRYYPTWLPSRRFIAAVVAIGGMQLLATMDSTVAIVALLAGDVAATYPVDALAVIVTK